MNNPTATPAVAEHGAAIVALEAEHDVIDLELGTLKSAILSGADGALIIYVLDRSIAFCEEHFAHEEGFLRDHGYGQVDDHAALHRELLDRFRCARDRAAGDSMPLAALDAFELLQEFKEHVELYDRPAYMEVEKRSPRTLRTNEAFAVHTAVL